MATCNICGEEIRSWQSRFSNGASVSHEMCLYGRTPAPAAKSDPIAPRAALKAWEYAKKNRLRRYHNRDKSGE